MIAIFPVVGFVATLLGLIEALFSANMIATTAGDERGAAILGVTTVLSSCFATTFLALLAMAMFSVFNMLQGRREKAFIREIESLLMQFVSKYKVQDLHQGELRREQEARERAEELRLRADISRQELLLADLRQRQADLDVARASREAAAKSAQTIQGTASNVIPVHANQPAANLPGAPEREAAG
jgi:hypothetical protein